MGILSWKHLLAHHQFRSGNSVEEAVKGYNGDFCIAPLGGRNIRLP